MRNHYNLNPPEPIAYPIEEDPNGLNQYAVDDHIFEEKYEEQHIHDFDYVETIVLEELIKNEPKQCI